jgi:hypothetical protein
VSKDWKMQERRVAERLSLWYTGHKKALKRMPLQGRMMEIRHGDIIANDDPRAKVPAEALAAAHRFHKGWQVDVKARMLKQKRKSGGYRTWQWGDLLTYERHPILEWWKTLTTQSMIERKRRLMVLTKGDRIWWMLVGDPEYAHFLEMAGEGVMASIRRIVFQCLTDEALHVFNLKEFLQKTPSDRLGGISTTPQTSPSVERVEI